MFWQIFKYLFILNVRMVKWATVQYINHVQEGINYKKIEK